MTKKPRSAKQIAAAKANLVKARAKNKGKKRSAKQIAASKANLAKARAARSAKAGTGLHRATGVGLSKHSKRGVAPLGSRRIASALHAQASHRKPTGINPRFKGRLAPTSFDVRGKWKGSHTHHFKKRLYHHKAHTHHLKHWRHRRGRLTPK